MNFGTLLRSTALTLLLLQLIACSPDFDPPYLVNKLRILAVRADPPEICPFGPEMCPPDTFYDTINVSLLAADENGVVADGINPNGPYLREGFELQWGICSYAFQGKVPEPDCTRGDNIQLEANGPFIPITAADLMESFAALFGGPPSAGAGAPPPDSEGFKIEDIFGQEEFAQTLGVAIKSSADRHWAIKQLTLSGREADLQNHNPVIEELTIGGIPLQPGDEPVAEVQTGYAYPIAWVIPASATEQFTLEAREGPVTYDEFMTLGFFATAGSFNQSGDEGQINIWMKLPEIKEFAWNPPLEVPKEGLEVTLFFNLLDARGGSTWTWGKVKVVRGESVMPK
jgi:hypothetical protein